MSDNQNFIYEPPAVAVVREVVAERVRQDSKWGEQNHTPAEWLAVLTEEVGEVAQEVLRNRFGGRGLGGYRAELVQVAAVAVAMIECLDRGTWRGDLPATEAEKQKAGNPLFAMKRLSSDGKSIFIRGPHDIELELDRDDVDTHVIDKLAPVIVETLNLHWPTERANALAMVAQDESAA